MGEGDKSWWSRFNDAPSDWHSPGGRAARDQAAAQLVGFELFLIVGTIGAVVADQVLFALLLGLATIALSIALVRFFRRVREFERRRRGD